MEAEAGRWSYFHPHTGSGEKEEKMDKALATQSLSQWWSSYSRAPPFKDPMTFPKVPPTGDQRFGYMNLWRTFLIQTTTRGRSNPNACYRIMKFSMNKLNKTYFVKGRDTKRVAGIKQVPTVSKCCLFLLTLKYFAQSFKEWLTTVTRCSFLHGFSP